MEVCVQYTLPDGSPYFATCTLPEASFGSPPETIKRELDGLIATIKDTFDDILR